MNCGSGAFGELLGDVAAFEPGNYVKSVGADDAGDLLDGNVGVAAHVRYVAGIVLVRKDKTHGVAVTLQCVVDANELATEILRAAPCIRGQRRECPG